jgi:hypothetical protein
MSSAGQNEGPPIWVGWPLHGYSARGAIKPADERNKKTTDSQFQASVLTLSVYYRLLVHFLETHIESWIPGWIAADAVQIVSRAHHFCIIEVIILPFHKYDRLLPGVFSDPLSCIYRVPPTHLGRHIYPLLGPVGPGFDPFDIYALV